MGVGGGGQLVLDYTDCFGDGIGACGLLDWRCGTGTLGCVHLKVAELVAVTCTEGLASSG